MKFQRIIQILSLVLAAVLVAIIAAPAAMTFAAPGIPADFSGYVPRQGEIWVWEKDTAHPSLTRCMPEQQEGLWYPPKGSASSSNYAACNATFSLAKYSVAIDGVPAICSGTDVVPMSAGNCSKLLPTGKTVRNPRVN